MRIHPAKIHWARIAVISAAGAWILALGFAFFLNRTLSEDAAQNAAAQRFEARHRELQRKLAAKRERVQLERRAATGDVRAMVALAEAFRRGSPGIAADEALAFAWYKRAAAAGDRAAMVEVAHGYESATGTPRDRAAAAEWYSRAAAQGHEGAARRIADIRWEEGNFPEALRWYQSCAPDDHVALRRIAEIHEWGRGVPRDLATAFFGFARLAELGDAWAQNKVGAMLAEGIGVPADPAAAVAWFQRAAERSPMARANLGLAYLRGAGLERDEKQGAALLQSAADSGDAYALTRLAVLHLAGAGGFKKDESRAIALLTQASAAGSDEARASLTMLQRDASGVRIDATRAFRLLEAEAVRGSPAAKMLVAKQLITGAPNVRPDWSRARLLAAEAAATGFGPALALHAVFLHNGIGGPAEPAAALEELRTAASQRDAYALVFLADLVAGGEAPRSDLPDLRRLREVLALEPGFAGPEATQWLEQITRELSDAPTPPAVEVEPFAGTRQPIVIDRTPPRYPFDLRYLDVTGVVVVDFIVDAGGNVQNAYAVQQSLPGFVSPAVKAVSQWRFQPGVKDGRPVATHMQVPVVFTLDDPPADAAAVRR